MSINSNKAVLIVEDSDEDYEAIMRAFKQATFTQPVIRCKSGDEVLNLLHSYTEHKDEDEDNFPALMLLDLNLPGTDGRDVLTEIKNDERLKQLPVVILTSSANPTDVEYCFQAGANSYLQKPINMQKFRQTMQQFVDYWFDVSILPCAADIKN